MINITLKDGSVKKYSEETSVISIAKDISEGLARNVISANFNNKVIETNSMIHEDGKLVIEVQHSKIPVSDAIERTNFWESLGYNVLWIFHESTLNKDWRWKLKDKDKQHDYTWEIPFHSVRTATKPIPTRIWWNTCAQVYVDYPDSGVSGRDHLMAMITGYRKLSKFSPDYAESFLHMTSQEKVKNFTTDVRTYLKQQLQKNNA